MHSSDYDPRFVGLAIVLLAAAVLVLAALLARRPSEASRPSSTALVPRDPMPVEVRRPSSEPAPLDADARGAIELWLKDAERPLATLRPIDVPARAAAPAETMPMGLLAPLLASVPEIKPALDAAPALEVVFSPGTAKALATGTGRLMQTAPGLAKAVAVDSKTGKVMEIGAVVAGGGLLASSGLALMAAGAAAAAIAQQRWLAGVLETLQRNTAGILRYLHDADHGQVEAAFDLVRALDDALPHGSAPVQLRLELAVARQSVDGIYFGRRRHIERIVDELDAIHTESEKAWSSAVAAVLGGKEPAWFESEVVLYLRAMVTRARLTSTTALLMALDGDPATGLALLESTATDLRDGHTALARKVRALASQPPKWNWANQQCLHESTRRLQRLMDDQIEPRLPPRELEAPRFVLQRIDGETWAFVPALLAA